LKDGRLAALAYGGDDAPSGEIASALGDWPPRGTLQNGLEVT